MAQMAGLHIELMALSGETFIPVELLAENEELVEMVIRNAEHQQILDFINENW
jgi:hypothetical protein